MTKRLEELFEFDRLESAEEPEAPALTVEQTRAAIVAIDTNIDKIDLALPAVRDLDASDRELDELADLAKQSYQDLSDLGMNVDSRFAAELFAVAGTMLGHALTAKQTKLQKKLKVIELTTTIDLFLLDENVRGRQTERKNKYLAFHDDSSTKKEISIVLIDV